MTFILKTTKIAILFIFAFVLGGLFVWYLEEETKDSYKFSPPIQTVFEEVEIFSPDLTLPISSPLVLTGRARGNWSFEASFPVTLKDENGNMLVNSYAQLQGKWMTTEFVPFISNLVFEKHGGYGTLVIKKDNPSDMREYDKQYEIPVVFQ